MKLYPVATIIAIALSTVISGASAADSAPISVTRAETILSVVGSPQNFIGSVWVDSRFQTASPADLSEQSLNEGLGLVQNWSGTSSSLGHIAGFDGSGVERLTSVSDEQYNALTLNAGSLATIGNGDWLTKNGVLIDNRQIWITKPVSLQKIFI